MARNIYNKSLVTNYKFKIIEKNYNISYNLEIELTLLDKLIRLLKCKEKK